MDLAHSNAESKLEKQIQSCIAMCGGSSIEERFAGLLLLSKIPNAHEFLLNESQKSFSQQLWSALNRDNFLARLLVLPNRTLCSNLSQTLLFVLNMNFFFFKESAEMETNLIQAQLASNILVSVFAHHVDIILSEAETAKIITQRLCKILASPSVTQQLQLDAVQLLLSLFGTADSLNSKVTAAISDTAPLVFKSVASLFATFSSEQQQQDAVSRSILSLATKLLLCLLNQALAAATPTSVEDEIISNLLPSLCSIILAAQTEAQEKAEGLSLLVALLDVASPRTRPAILKSFSKSIRSIVLLFLSSKLSAELRELAISASKHCVAYLGWEWTISTSDKLSRLLLHTISIEMNLLCTDLLSSVDPNSNSKSAQATPNSSQRALQMFQSCSEHLKKAVDYLSKQAELLEDESTDASKLALPVDEIESHFKILSTTIGYIFDVLNEIEPTDVAALPSLTELFAAMLDLLQHWILEGGPLQDNWERFLTSAKGLELLIAFTKADARLSQFVWPMLIMSEPLRERIYNQTEIVIPALIAELKKQTTSNFDADNAEDGSGDADMCFLAAEMLEELCLPPQDGGPIHGIEPDRIFDASSTAEDDITALIKLIQQIASSKYQAVDSRRLLLGQRLIFIVLSYANATASSLPESIKKDVSEKTKAALSQFETLSSADESKASSATQRLTQTNRTSTLHLPHIPCEYP